VRRTGLDRRHLRPPAAHPLDVGRLAADVLGPHVDDALEAEQGAGGGGGDPVLPGAGLGDHPRLAHPLRQQRLPIALLILWAPVWARSSRFR
jgi:hypothetical protein